MNAIPPKRRISESPPDWWDDYPFEPQEPNWDSLSSGAPVEDDRDSRPAPKVIGPNCVPVSITSIPELHYIAPASNLDSIRKLGILSHNQAGSVPYSSVADPEVNQRRSSKRLLSGRIVHDYANLYFNARNPMLSRLLKASLEPLCVVRVASRVLRLPGVLFTDGNAANASTRAFYPTGENVLMDRSRVFLRYWPVPGNPAQERENTRCLMAEVLVPDIISPHFIVGIDVQSQASIAEFTLWIDRSMIRVNKHLFFSR